MSTPPNIELSPFQQWVAQAFRAGGADLPEVIDPLGAEFEAEGRKARVLPHSDDGWAVIEVEVKSLAELQHGDASRLALDMMKLNHDARFEHRWMIIIDDDDMMSITTQVDIAATDSLVLGEILSDGVERAGMLAEAVNGLLSGQVAQLQSAAAPDPSAYLLRG